MRLIPVLLCLALAAVSCSEAEPGKDYRDEIIHMLLRPCYQDIIKVEAGADKSEADKRALVDVMMKVNQDNVEAVVQEWNKLLQGKDYKTRFLFYEEGAKFCINTGLGRHPTYPVYLPRY